MPFLKQNRPAKVKEIYRALKRDHPDMPAGMKARIASRKGNPDPQMRKSPKHGGPPYKGPLTKGAGLVGDELNKKFDNPRYLAYKRQRAANLLRDVRATYPRRQSGIMRKLMAIHLRRGGAAY